MKRNSLITIIIVSLFIALVACSSEEQTDSNSKTDSDNVEQISFYDNSRINDQKQIEQNLLDEYNQQTYSANEPFITLDPYGVAPLTALVMFKTDEPMQIKLTVEGKDDNSDIVKTFKSYETEHQLPVLGLYPNYDNTVTIQATNKDGKTVTTELTIQTEPLPDDFLTTDLVKADKERMENGLTFIVPSTRYVYAVDDNAEVRWYSTLWNSHIFKRLENGNLLYITKEKGQEKYNELLEMDMLGKVSNSYLIQLDGYEDTNVVHHDVIELSNGNLLATVHDMNSDYVEDKMIEIDRETGETVQEFNYRDMFPEDFYQNYDGPSSDEGDWLHQNSIGIDGTDKTFLMTSRHQDLAMKHSYPEGEIKWILAAPEEWPDDYDNYLLEPKGDVKYPAGPHAIMTLPDQDNNEKTTDYLLFDNNIVVTRGNEDSSGDYSRAVQYRINEEEKTVEEVWSYGEERGESFFSSIVGDADYLNDTGNRLLTSGYIEAENGMNSRVVEVNDEDPAEVIYEIVISGFEDGSHRQAYRAERMPLYPDQEWNVDLSK